MWQNSVCPRRSDNSKKEEVTIQEFSKIFQDIQSAKDKMLEADLSLVEKSKTICQGIEKDAHSASCFSKLHKGRQSTVKLLLVSFLQRNKAL